MIPIRSCIACRKRDSWSELLHLVALNGQVKPDPEKRLPGRGAWLHRDCLELAVNRRAFSRAFKSEGELDLGEVKRFIEELRNDTSS